MRFNRFFTGTNSDNSTTSQMIVNRFRPDGFMRINFGRANAMQDNGTPLCQKVSEDVVDGDLFITDVLELFFRERLTSVSLNDALRQTAAYAAEQANQLIPAADALPRPANSRATPAWLVSDVAQTAFRKAQNKCLYVNVRNTIYQRLRTQYEKDKEAAMPLAGSQSNVSNSLEVNNLTTSQAGTDLIKRFEGFRANLYNDVAGHCTIGYGTLVHRGNCNGSESEEFRAGITDERATELLMREINSKAAVVNDSVNVVLNQNQFDALVSFVYNVGEGAFRRSTLLRELNAGNYRAVPVELRKWVKAGGKTVQGLVNRRNDELTLFNTPITASTSQSVAYRNKQCGCQEQGSAHGTRPLTNIPRGIRNNNPGNIEMNDNNAWEGKVPRGQNTDGRFEQFTSYAYGVRALILLLRNYLRGTKNTLTLIFGAYAPPSENNTQSYIQFVSERIGIGANNIISITKTNLKAIAQAIGRMENGQEAISDTQFDEGWALLPPDIANSIGQSMFSNARQNTSVACLPDAAFNTKWTTVKNNVINIANEEYQLWTKPDGTRYPETDPFVTNRLIEYWNIVGLNPRPNEVQNTTWQNSNYWSAVFISWVMYSAQARQRQQSFPISESLFKIASAHTQFAYAAKQNAFNNDYDNPFWLCRPGIAIPEPGDIIVRNRANTNGVMGTITYDSLAGSGASHSDIVTEINTATNRLTVIGGNKTGQSVNKEVYSLNPNGTIDTNRHTNLIGIIKLKTDKCQIC